jgi:AhpD family alkylhydroperoxidase
MARIAGKAKPGLWTRLVYWYVRRRLGRVPEPVQIMAHNGWVMAAAGMYDMLAPKARVLSERDKGMVSVLVAMNVGCRFCIDIGSALARTHGVSVDELRGLVGWQQSGCFSPRDRLLLELAEAMTATPAHISESLFRKLEAELSPPALVELASAIAWENYLARFNHAFGAQEEGFSEGSYCALPPRAPRVEVAEARGAAAVVSGHG